ncbi:MAG TPA: hypothetical protein VNN79_09415 [Actinomycetota bacterium]|nr:hypothetical protein [Actinomycetota bacterium]
MEAAWSPAALCVAVAALVSAAAVGWWALQEGRAAPRPGAARRFPFGHPAGSEHAEDVGHPEGAPRRRPGFAMEPWMVVALALFVAAIVVVPRLIGVSFLVLPFVLGRRRPGRRPFGGTDEPREHDDPGGHPG